MATTVIQGVQPRTRSLRSMPQLVLGWVLMIPLVFYAVHGTPSFEGAEHGRGDDGNSSLSGLASNGSKGGDFGISGHPGGRFFDCHVVSADQREASFLDGIANETAHAVGVVYDMFCGMVTRSLQIRLNGCFYLIETFFAFYLVS